MKKFSSMILVTLLITLTPICLCAESDKAVQSGKKNAESAAEMEKGHDQSVRALDDEKNDTDEIDQAQKALQYGLESEILEVLHKVDKHDFSLLQEDCNRLFTQTKSSAVREGLFSLYQKYEDPQLITYAIELLQNYEAQRTTVVKAALVYLAALKPTLTPEFTSLLQKILTGDTEKYGTDVVSLLGAVGTEEHATFLTDYFDSLTLDDVKQELILKQSIMAALENLHKEGTRSFLLERAQDENENKYIRSSAIAGLAKMGNPDIIPELVAFFESSEPLLREAAIRGAASFDTDETRELIVQGLKDNYYKVRLEALKAVKQKQLQQAASYVLYRAQHDPSDDVTFLAVETLSVLNTVDGNAWLSETFCNPKKGEKVRAAILSAVLKHNPAVFSADFEKAVLETLKDNKQKKIRYVFGKEIAKIENTVTGAICQAFLESDDVLTKSIGLDMFKTNNPQSARALVEFIAQDEKQGALQRRAQRLLGTTGQE